MAIHSSILAWRIPRMEKPGRSSGLPSMHAPPQRETLPSPQGVVLPSYVLGLVPYRAQDITDSGALISCQEEEEEAGREAGEGKSFCSHQWFPGFTGMASKILLTSPGLFSELQNHISTSLTHILTSSQIQSIQNLIILQVKKPMPLAVLCLPFSLGTAGVVP